MAEDTDAAFFDGDQDGFLAAWDLSSDGEWSDLHSAPILREVRHITPGCEAADLLLISVSGRVYRLAVSGTAPEVVFDGPLNASVASVSLSCQTSTMAMGLDDGSFAVVQLDGNPTEGAVVVEAAHLGSVDVISIHEGQRVLATGGQTNSVQLWDLPTLRRIGSPLPDAAMGLSMSSDLEWMLLVSVDGPGRARVVAWQGLLSPEHGCSVGSQQLDVAESLEVLGSMELETCVLR
jgi:WD40 repeat protein